MSGSVWAVFDLRSLGNIDRRQRGGGRNVSGGEGRGLDGDFRVEIVDIQTAFQARRSLARVGRDRRAVLGRVRGWGEVRSQ